MKRRNLRVLTGLAVTALAVSTSQISNVTAQAVTSPADRDPAAAQAQKHDDLKSPLSEKQRALREKATQQLIKGTAKIETKGGQRVINVGGKYVQYAVSREESVFTILSDFGTVAKSSVTGGSAGPLNNQIPAPDRVWGGTSGTATDDNSTNWTASFDRDHFQNLMFGTGESFKDFYLKQSNGRFLAKGDVSEWVTVPYNEASYGSNSISDAQGAWPFIEDTATAWYDAQVAAGKSSAEIKAYLAQFDKVDRYDYNNNGNFNEPDGYIDHFQAIHAGEGEEAGGGAQGADAIWSHRFYVNSTDVGASGPAGNFGGGTQIGNTGMWIGDYTTEPENGGLGVFSHEFGHDLGLPDLYDTAGGDNGTGFWTLMSGGSWLNRGDDSIGTTPGYLGAWGKLQLGWLDYTQVNYGTNAVVRLGPANLAGKLPQAVLVNLPDKSVTTDYNKPNTGVFEWWGGSADSLSNTLTRTVDLSAASTSATVSSWAKYDIEKGFDYLYGEVSTDGVTWSKVGAPGAAPVDFPIGGVSGGALDEDGKPAYGKSIWVPISYDLSDYKGMSNVQFRFRYVTDGGLHFAGPFLDDLKLTLDGAVTPIWTDDVESGVNGWTAKGFTRMGGSVTKDVSSFYLAENRVYSGYDAALKTGPYNFGFASTQPDWVERFPYQNGLLVWYSDGACTDNNTIDHAGCGQALPVDARPAPVMLDATHRLGNRRQGFDATFGQEATDAVTFHRNGVPAVVPSQPAIPTFDDSDPNRYWTALNPMASTKVAGSGTKISVLSTSANGDQMTVQVRTKG